MGDDIHKDCDRYQTAVHLPGGGADGVYSLEKLLFLYDLAYEITGTRYQLTDLFTIWNAASVGIIHTVALTAGMDPHDYAEKFYKYAPEYIPFARYHYSKNMGLHFYNATIGRLITGHISPALFDRTRKGEILEMFFGDKTLSDLKGTVLITTHTIHPHHQPFPFYKVDDDLLTEELEWLSPANRDKTIPLSEICKMGTAVPTIFKSVFSEATGSTHYDGAHVELSELIFTMKLAGRLNPDVADKIHYTFVGNGVSTEPMEKTIWDSMTPLQFITDGVLTKRVPQASTRFALFEGMRELLGEENVMIWNEPLTPPANAKPGKDWPTLDVFDTRAEQLELRRKVARHMFAKPEVRDRAIELVKFLIAQHHIREGTPIPDVCKEYFCQPVHGMISPITTADIALNDAPEPSNDDVDPAATPDTTQDVAQDPTTPK